MDVGVAVVRIALGLYLVAHGLQLLSPQGSAGAANWFAHGGVRGGRAAVHTAGVAQLGSGALLVVGFLTPLAGMGAAGVMIVAAQLTWKSGFWAVSSAPRDPRTEAVS